MKTPLLRGQLGFEAEGRFELQARKTSQRENETAFHDKSCPSCLVPEAPQYAVREYAAVCVQDRVRRKSERNTLAWLYPSIHSCQDQAAGTMHVELRVREREKRCK